jgi:hypothetical protein
MNILEDLPGSFLSDLREFSSRAMVARSWRGEISAKLEIQADMIDISQLLTNEIKGL